ncbi:mucin-5AC [Orussus abietinus]|uniref:mucin-5AC n=1 Tax=Orussus abietinus TaxID=222816 RepID=UPI00062593C5|nr:mucin-5AC [Orussus abietinus]
MLNIEAPAKLVLTLQSVPPFAVESFLALGLAVLLAVPLVGHVQFLLEEAPRSSKSRRRKVKRSPPPDRTIVMHYPAPVVIDSTSSSSLNLNMTTARAVCSTPNFKSSVDLAAPKTGRTVQVGEVGGDREAPHPPPALTLEHSSSFIATNAELPVIDISTFNYGSYRHKLVESTLRRRYGDYKPPGNVVLNAIHLNAIESDAAIRLSKGYSHSFFDFVEEYYDATRSMCKKETEFLHPLDHFLVKGARRPTTDEKATETTGLDPGSPWKSALGPFSVTPMSTPPTTSPPTPTPRRRSASFTPRARLEMAREGRPRVGPRSAKSPIGSSDQRGNEPGKSEECSSGSPRPKSTVDRGPPGIPTSPGHRQGAGTKIPRATSKTANGPSSPATSEVGTKSKTTELPSGQRPSLVKEESPAKSRPYLRSATDSGIPRSVGRAPGWKPERPSTADRGWRSDLSSAGSGGSRSPTPRSRPRTAGGPGQTPGPQPSGDARDSTATFPISESRSGQSEVEPVADRQGEVGEWSKRSVRGRTWLVGSSDRFASSVRSTRLSRPATADRQASSRLPVHVRTDRQPGGRDPEPSKTIGKPHMDKSDVPGRPQTAGSVPSHGTSSSAERSRTSPRPVADGPERPPSASRTTRWGPATGRSSKRTVLSGESRREDEQNPSGTPSGSPRGKDRPISRFRAPISKTADSGKDDAKDKSPSLPRSNSKAGVAVQRGLKSYIGRVKHVLHDSNPGRKRPDSGKLASLSLTEAILPDLKSVLSNGEIRELKSLLDRAEELDICGNILT